MPLIDALSAARFATYATWAGNDTNLALRLYSYNTTLSATLYSPLHMLEVTLRNTIDRQMVQSYGPDWLDGQTVALTHYQTTSIATARQTVQRQGKVLAHDPVIAELNFGFWTSLFGHASAHLWSALRPIFNTKGLQRKGIAGILSELRELRNRIAHHEPIIGQPLDDRYAKICKVTGWMEPDAEVWINQVSTWPAVYIGQAILVLDQGTGRLKVDPGASSRI